MPNVIIKEEQHLQLFHEQLQSWAEELMETHLRQEITELLFFTLMQKQAFNYYHPAYNTTL